MQLASFLEDPQYQDQHSLHMEIIKTFGRVGPNAEPRFRDECKFLHYIFIKEKKNHGTYAKVFTVCTEKNTIACCNVMKTVLSWFCDCVCLWVFGRSILWWVFFSMLCFLCFFPQLFFLICTNWLCATTSRRWKVKELTLPLNCLRRTAPYPAVVSFIVTLERDHF